MNAVLTRIDTPPDTLARACATLDALKRLEAEATLSRVAAEQRIIALSGALPDEGTTTLAAHGWKLKITTALRRKVDADKLTEIAGQIPEKIGARLIRWKPELVTSELRYLQDNEVELYALVARAITATPAKPSVKIEREDT